MKGNFKLVVMCVDQCQILLRKQPEDMKDREIPTKRVGVESQSYLCQWNLTAATGHRV